MYITDIELTHIEQFGSGDPLTELMWEGLRNQTELISIELARLLVYMKVQ